MAEMTSLEAWVRWWRMLEQPHVVVGKDVKDLARVSFLDGYAQGEAAGEVRAEKRAAERRA